MSLSTINKVVKLGVNIPTGVGKFLGSNDDFLRRTKEIIGLGKEKEKFDEIRVDISVKNQYLDRNSRAQGTYEGATTQHHKTPE